MNGMNTEKLGQIVKLLADVRVVLDGGYHYSSPRLRTCRESPDLPVSLLVERPDALALLGDVAVDLENVAAHLAILQGEARELEVDTKALCGADLSLYNRIYATLAKDVTAAWTAANEALNGTSTGTGKPDRRRGPRTPRSSTAQTSLESLVSEPTNPEEADHATSTGQID